jgi:hypothetical protein
MVQGQSCPPGRVQLPSKSSSPWMALQSVRIGWGSSHLPHRRISPRFPCKMSSCTSIAMAFVARGQRRANGTGWLKSLKAQTTKNEIVPVTRTCERQLPSPIRNRRKQIRNCCPQGKLAGSAWSFVQTHIAPCTEQPAIPRTLLASRDPSLVPRGPLPHVAWHPSICA